MKPVAETARELDYDYGHMTLGECIRVAEETRMSVGEVILREAVDSTGLTGEQVAASMEEAFAHNLCAAGIGATTGRSFLLGAVGQDLAAEDGAKIAGDPFVDRIVTYTLAAQVGNHTIGLCPCAGTGDACPYTGFVKAVKEFYTDKDLITRVMAVILKIGGIFRVGKRTTGCNMEGIGAAAESRELARRANPITKPFAEAVVGGSSQGVGSPTNCGRIAHFLSEGRIKKVKIELYSELFARRAINVPGILMAAVDGAGTSDADAYREILAEVRRRGIEVEILEVDEPSVQRVTIEAEKQNSMVDSLNRGGARLVLRDASPSVERAREIAEELNIVLIDQ